MKEFGKLQIYTLCILLCFGCKPQKENSILFINNSSITVDSIHFNISNNNGDFTIRNISVGANKKLLFKEVGDSHYECTVYQDDRILQSSTGYLTNGMVFHDTLIITDILLLK